MKASEVLRRYAAGERNFKRLNLQSQSFKNQDLSGADFSEADIRGTDFSSAGLREAKFNSARAGLPVHRAFILIVFLFPAILAVGIGFGLAGLFSVIILNLAYVQEYLIGSSVVGAILILSLSYVVSQRYSVARETWGKTGNYQKLDLIVGLSARRF
ncbi:MAG: pentapeptide repeat-containing protein [Cyanobacteriota bacterium]|nr:pentapeptide repeat-containing protein [Cyanobacteriota bacterium]